MSAFHQDFPKEVGSYEIELGTDHGASWWIVECHPVPAIGGHPPGTWEIRTLAPREYRQTITVHPDQDHGPYQILRCRRIDLQHYVVVPDPPRRNHVQ